MQVREVDPRDDEAFASWFAVAHAAERDGRPDEPGWLLEEQRQISLDGFAPDPDTACVLLAVREGDKVVGAARLELPQRDNHHLCEVSLFTHPAVRRRGVGRALDVEVAGRVRALGRTTIVTMSDEPPGWEERSPGRLAGLALGYAVAQQEIRRDIDLPLDPARADELEAACRPYARDYEIRIWWDRCPDDLAVDRARLATAMSTDVPKDEMDWREEVWDVARLRRYEARAVAMGRRFVSAGAVHMPSGRLVAYTDMGLPRGAPERAYQWDTLVRREHRGHRLGMLVKLAALRELAATSPETRFISTWNAQENAPMIAVNEALGARTNGRLAILQKLVSGSAA